MGLLARFLDHLVRLSGRVSLAQPDRIIRIRSALFALLVPIRPRAHRLVRHVLQASPRLAPRQVEHPSLLAPSAHLAMQGL